MKATQTFLVFTFILFSITSASAQYGYGTNPYGGRSNSGASMINQASQPAKPKEIPAEERAAQIIENMKPALNLDELQVIAISNVLVESINEQGRIRKLDSSQDDQIKDFQALSESTDRKINQFLSAEQKEKYTIFKVDNQNPKKTKEKSKSKEKKEKKE